MLEKGHPVIFTEAIEILNEMVPGFVKASTSKIQGLYKDF